MDASRPCRTFCNWLGRWFRHACPAAGAGTAVWRTAEAAQTNQAAQANQATLTGDLAWAAVLSRPQRHYLHAQLYQRFSGERLPAAIKPGAVGIGVFQPQTRYRHGQLAGLEVVISTPMASSPTGLFSARRSWQDPGCVESRSGARGAALFVLVRTECASMTASPFAPASCPADSLFLQSKTAANFINNGISWRTPPNLPAPEDRPIRFPGPRHSRSG